MNVVGGHAHGNYGYRELKPKDWLNLLKNTVETKLKHYRSLNLHFPFELQHPGFYPRLNMGLNYVRIGEVLKKLLGIKLYWENAPAQTNKTWILKHGQTDWVRVPDNIELTLDTGHLILGARNIAVARARIETILRDRGKQIKHLHLHENDLVHDTHEPVGKMIDKKLLAKLIKNRTYIFEKGVPQSEW